ncbi:AraC family transcriptional regulator [Pseudomonas sp. CCI3.2]|uniref:helix-turn-helix transcriptional regulator n=1 Tax=unclassified Pseudomonas TaxID=196821 RepID=UPI002AC9AE63|nr:MULTISPECIES: AraC family transcriptional regulator [unclassified Pseudomonas]MEB0079149.1 AraC family transcriptional regulator [Pseudomonas sp. MH10out]MEB0102094.1 AraC family transcriptional regulator [Pseudomonas sp. CCI3.2]MEB0132263.1 AraC family transcriptional regulator [Pseudomonas sp. CCI2.4]MEB0160492.1 AraC family transcriptional regulator [Pseudomonas sp. AH2 (2023)]MEB0168535.1 AraC family transcriptional regulator [Pseudomonas sp. CCC4.4]
MSTLSRIPTYDMQQRSDRADFYIRDKSARPPLTTPHRHEYFQIQINLGGDTVQHIGGAIRAFARNTLAFILPHRLHVIPHPDDGNFVLINFSQEFFLQHLPCDPMDLEDVSLAQAPELAPFRFQEHLDFVLDDANFSEVEGLLQKMRELDQNRQLGTGLMLKGYLLQLIGKVCNVYEAQLLALSASKAEKRGRRDALGRVSSFIREHIADPEMTLKDAAAAAFLSPNYLTHLLRKETGSTFSELVLERRMRLARTHLINTTKPVSHIAEVCGFADEAYFSRRFRKANGLPPGQFRRLHREG